MTSRIFEDRTEQLLARLALVALTVLCLWLVSRLVATVLDASAPVIPGNLPSLPGALIVPSESVAGWHLFGHAQQPTDPRTVVQAPETDQALTLYGVLADGDPARGVAFIADAGGSQSAYRVGAELPGGSRLRAVHGNHVVLDRGGSAESLSLTRRDGGSATASGAPHGSGMAVVNPAAVIAPTAPTISGAGSVDWAAVQRQIEVDPAELARQVRVMPVMEGGAVIGMRLSGGAAAPLIARAGLQPDDIVTAVNGISVRDVGRAQQILASVRDADRVTVTVRRDGREQTLNVDLK